MEKIHTHYDNLNVARDAPIEVIRAAYRSLAIKYHPDKNPGDTEAARMMSSIYSSFEVLSDKEKRRQYDQWIEKEELNSEKIFSEKPKPKTKTIPKTPGPLSEIITHLSRYWGIYLIAILIISGLLIAPRSAPPPGPKPYEKTPSTETPKLEIPKYKYVKPLTAPNGEYWPNVAGYVKGYSRLNIGGYSSVTIDNSGNDSDVFVKLISLDGTNAFPVRQFYIPAFGKFTLNKVTAGTYDIRYRDLNTGHLSRSEAFTLHETKSDEGVHYSVFTLTLYKVTNGNMQTYDLSEDEF